MRYLVLRTPWVYPWGVSVTYPSLAGGLNSVATVLSELIEAMSPNKLLELISAQSQKAWWQRLGYILEHIDVFEQEKLDSILDILRQYASTQTLTWVPLASEIRRKGVPRDQFWKII